MLAAEIGDRNPGLVLLQNPDDLFFCKPFALHALVLVLGQNELQTGLSPRGKVTRQKATRCRAFCLRSWACSRLAPNYRDHAACLRCLAHGGKRAPPDV